jgi:Tol biopolymer transport system component
MSKVDDELTRRFRRAERPADGFDLFEGLERRRSHRERLRRVQAGLLAFAVLAASAGGFVALSLAFGEQPGKSQSPLQATNGIIVFSDRASDGHEHLFGINPDGSGLHQITDFATDDTNPAVSPDGRTIVFLHELEDRRPVIASMPIDGGAVTWLTEPDLFATDGPAWSPDGSRIVFAAHDGHLQRIFVVEADGSRPQPITGDGTPWAEDPVWSPDGTKVAFSASPNVGDAGPTTWDVFTVGPDGEGLLNITDTPDVGSDEFGPTWSPDGRRISFSRTRGDGASIVVRTLAGGSETMLTVGSSIDAAPAWSPDGQRIVFERAPVSEGRSDLWLMRPDGSEVVRLTSEGGFSPAWQQLPLEQTPTVSPEPSLSPSPGAESRDIGLGFDLCNVERLAGIDFLGDGTMGTAWTGNKATAQGVCPDNHDDRYGVAVDFTGDGLADSWSGETIASCVSCEPFKAVDLNGDGTDDLIVALSYFSIMQYGLYTVMPVDGELEVVPFRTGEPGHPQYALDAGKPFTFWVGGDAGISDYFYCDRLPQLRLTGTESPVDGGADTVTTVHETHVSLGRDGIAHILDAQTYTVTGVVDLQYATSKPDCALGVDIWR